LSAGADHASRMSIAQLADRISHMEATEAKYSIKGDRHEKPSQRFNRTHKLAPYRADLAPADRRKPADRAARLVAQAA